MKKINRRSFLAAAGLTAAALALTACGGSASSAASSTASSVASTAASAAADGKSYTIGICQLVEHAALDAATQGFEDALTEQFGDNVKFDFQNAQNDSNGDSNRFCRPSPVFFFQNKSFCPFFQNESFLF